MTAREVEKIIESAGWQFARQKGSHRHYRHASLLGFVTIPFHPGDIPTGTVNNILRQAGVGKTK